MRNQNPSQNVDSDIELRLDQNSTKEALRSRKKIKTKFVSSALMLVLALVGANAQQYPNYITL